MPYPKFIILIFVFLAPASQADSMRCGGKLVTLGDTKVETIINCGQPLNKETITVKEKTEYSKLAMKYPLLYKNGLLKGSSNGARIGSRVTITTSFDLWTYNLGAGKFLRTLYFERGKLVGIADGDRI
jgi:hypothetical protein